jgi:hypothetical protein
MLNKTTVFGAALALALMAGMANAKIPAPVLDDAAKAKAAEAKAKADDAAKKDAEMLGKAQDQVAARYIKEQKAKGITVKPTPIVAAAAPAAPAPAAPAAAAKPDAKK